MVSAFCCLAIIVTMATVGERGALRTGYFLCDSSTVVFLPAEGHDLSSRATVKCECSDLDYVASAALAPPQEVKAPPQMLPFIA